MEQIFKKDHISIMGILNVTPDSFSDGGKHFSNDSAVNRALMMIGEGTDIIDIGGESTRPGASPVSVNEELERILPVINGILAVNPETVISVDTYKSEVADEALKSGAKIVNDISGGTFDADMFSVVKKYDAAIVLMHIKGTPKDMQQNPSYQDVVKEIYNYLDSQSKKAFNAGIKNIIVDPGIGFGKSIEHNLQIIKSLSEFKSLGFPILIGNSRKSFLGKITGLDVNNRETASVIMDSFAVNAGARVIRTHNVSNAVQLKQIYNSLYHS